MDVGEKFLLIVKQHNTRWHVGYGEVTPFFDNGYACVAHKQYLAACLCFVTGIEMSLRLPLLLEKGKDLRDAWNPKGSAVPLLENSLLLLAKDLGLPVEILRYSSEKDEVAFMGKLHGSDHASRARIVRLRNNICHGNLNIFVTEHEEGARIPTSDIEDEARELERIALAWAVAYGRWRDSVETA
ncbi:MAG: hypothetical protein JWQ01_4743 [Massilia sp.]|nr:hypothetical protein [Massilia sp.]